MNQKKTTFSIPSKEELLSRYKEKAASTRLEAAANDRNYTLMIAKKDSIIENEPLDREELLKEWKATTPEQAELDIKAFDEWINNPDTSIDDLFPF